MNNPNTYTYRQSELPEFTDAMKAEIAAVDHLVGNLLSKLQGNPLALNYLYEILQDGLNSCDLNLASIQIVSDGYKSESKITLVDLPIDQKRIVFDTAFTNTVMLKVVASLSGDSMTVAASKIASVTADELLRFEPTDEAVEKAISDLVAATDRSSTVTPNIIIVPLN